MQLHTQYHLTPHAQCHLAARRSRRVNYVATTCCQSASTDVAQTVAQQGSKASNSRAAATKIPVQVVFKPENVSAMATPGQCFADVAAEAGVEVALGCNQGNCGVCEMELEKFSSQGEGQPLTSSGSLVIRTCIARVPPGFQKLEVTAMTDQIWGVDGFDT